VQDVPMLADPITVRGVTLRNRIVMPPMQSGKASFEGAVTNRLINFYVRRGAALGLPIVEHAYVSVAGKLSHKQLGIYDDTLVEGFRSLADAIHKVGAPAVLQITHAGAVANKTVTGSEPVGPTARQKNRALEKAELAGVAEEFVLAAERALKAGFDGVELHGAHGYLLCQFFSPLFNKRADEFGGSVENRMCFPLMVVDRVREALGSKLLLYRLGADDLAPNGTHVEDAVEFAKHLEEAGVDIIDVSGGMCGAYPKQLKKVNGYFVPQASRIKQAVKTPVIGVGHITQPEHAEQLVRDELVDLVAIGRAFLKDPDWAQKALEATGNRHLQQ
jgi:NADPH2 dehydrogenase